MPEERAPSAEQLNGRTRSEPAGAAADVASFSTRDANRAGARSSAENRSLDCPACGHANLHRFLYTKNGCDILRCEQCGLGRAETSGFEPESYYTGDYFSGKQSDGYPDYVGAQRILRREFAGTVEFIQKFRASGHLLEVGCAYGFFLQEAKRAFAVSGIELAEDAAEYCRQSGLQVLTGMVTERALETLGTADVMVLLDVIEHLPAPADTLALLVDHLNPGGIVVITTGDFGALSSRIAGAHWRLMTPPQHLWFFSPTSMRRLGASHGLEVESIDHPWKIVPLSLIGFQLARMLGIGARLVPVSGGVGVPVNLFDAMRVVLRKPAL